MKTLDQWLTLYGESHQNPMNKNIHRLCVPLIMLSLLGLIALIPTPMIMTEYRLNFSHLLVIGALIFYFMLSRSFFTVMIGVVSLMLLVNERINTVMTTGEALMLWMSIFVLGWIGQFIGHKVEGKKPSFLQDLTFLFIGPLWTVAPLFPRYRSTDL